jgi:hypothetical protein
MASCGEQRTRITAGCELPSLVRGRPVAKRTGALFQVGHEDQSGIQVPATPDSSGNTGLSTRTRAVSIAPWKSVNDSIQIHPTKNRRVNGIFGIREKTIAAPLFEFRGVTVWA